MTDDSANERYFTHLAAAFVRGKLSVPISLSDEETIALGHAAGLRLHKFKRQTELPRVKRVLGVLQGLAPFSLLDLGSGRGTFLWPLLDAFPYVEITAIDINPVRVADINAVHQGGIKNLRALQMDATAIDLKDKSVDVVTALEVLEHLEQACAAAKEAVRLARNFVVASVPSKEDDNPEHIQLFDKNSFAQVWLEAGAKSIKVEYVLNHMLVIAKV